MHHTDTAAGLDAKLLTLTPPALGELDDGELLTLTRRGLDEAFAALFARHTYAAHRLACHLGHREDAEDIVAESFAQVLDVLRRGKGPERAFRAYLFTTIRHEAGRRAKARQRVTPTDDERHIDAIVPFGGGALDEFEKSAVRAAYESLPDRWRTVLWHLDVEGRKPQELGRLLEMSPNSVSALVYRARAALREAYLRQHVSDQGAATSGACRDVREKLSAYVRRTASVRERATIGAHLETCSGCEAIHADLREVNRQVGTTSAGAAAIVSVLGVVTGAFASALVSFTAHVLTVGKAALTAAAPPATVAAFTAATIMGVTASDVIDPPRHPIAVQEDAPVTNRPAARAATPVPSPPPRATPPPTKAVEPLAAAGARPAELAAEGSSAGPGAEATPAPEPEPQPEPQPAPRPAVAVDLGRAAAIEIDDSGVRARIASVTIEIPSRMLASTLSLGTTN